MFDCASDEVSIRSDGDNDDMLSREGKKRSHQSERKRPCDDLCDKEDEDLANCLVMLSNSGTVDHARGKSIINQRRIEQASFKCKACNKVFKSHQALGGHRASHKKVKGCFASGKRVIALHDEEDEDEDRHIGDGDENQEEEKSAHHQLVRKQSNCHECTICHRVFASGQALGGHKRCHWLTSTSAGNHQTPLYVEDSEKPVVGNCEPLDRPSLDLNLGCLGSSSYDRMTKNKRKSNRFKLNDHESMTVQMVHRSSPSSWLQLASGH